MDSLPHTIETCYPHIYTVSVQHAGETEFEYAKPGYKHKVRTVRSVTKSIIATLYGIAIQQGYLNNLDAPVMSYFPEYRSGKLDASTNRITIRHLLTMTSGLDSSDRQPKGYFRSKNWVRFYLERLVKYEPGTRVPVQLCRFTRTVSPVVQTHLTECARLCQTTFIHAAGHYTQPVVARSARLLSWRVRTRPFLCQSV